MVSRLEGWEDRLQAIIEDARARPYVLGEHDCFRLACRVIEALTGVDRWSEFAGYTTKRGALAKLAQYGHSFEDAGDWFFGSPSPEGTSCGARIDVKRARRGDILALQDDAGEKHLAVCLGHQMACMREDGLLFMNTSAAHCGWRVG